MCEESNTGSPANHAVVIAGIALQLRHGLAPARGTSVEVREFGRLAIERRDDALRRQRHFVHAAVTEINQLVGMPRYERGLVAHMPGVRAGGGISFGERRG